MPDSLQQKIQTQKQCPQLQASPSLPSRATGNSVTESLKVSELSQINLNTASLEELVALPGVGAKLAQRIITARQQKMFTSLEDLDRLPGVGPSLLEKLRDRVTW